jgi:DNA (cytosine-5)-methyltransferase 1
MDYYNEIDWFAVEWLKNLMGDGLIPHGKIDNRSIELVKPEDLRGYRQCHFFAGIAGWPEALRLAGWPSDVPVWTGSPPCQSFSSAGNRKGLEDERNLWPEFFRLIRICRPPVIFGEQVEAAIGLNWLDRVFDDMEAENYSCRSIVLPACSVNAPHIRQRLFWMAYDTRNRMEKFEISVRQREQEPQTLDVVWSCCGSRPRMAHDHDYLGRSGVYREEERAGAPAQRERGSSERCTDIWVEESSSPGREGIRSGWKETCLAESSELQDFWGESQWVECGDGKYRRIPLEPSLFPLAPRVSGRVGILRGTGNSIVPPLAARFIIASMMEVYDEIL